MKLSLIIALLAVLMPSPSACAETLYLKDGSRIQGAIVKEDAESFTVTAQTGHRKVLKAEVETVPPPDPLVAVLLGLVVPGAGQAYAGDYGRAAVTFGTGVLSGVAAYLAARQAFQQSQAVSVLTAGITLAVPDLLGAYDAYALASKRAKSVRYHIDYSN